MKIILSLLAAILLMTSTHDPHLIIARAPEVIAAQPDDGAATHSKSNNGYLSHAPESDSAFFDLLQRTAFDFFWREANPNNGLIKDRGAASAHCLGRLRPFSNMCGHRSRLDFARCRP